MIFKISYCIEIFALKNLSCYPSFGTCLLPGAGKEEKRGALEAETVGTEVPHGIFS